MCFDSVKLRPKGWSELDALHAGKNTTRYSPKGLLILIIISHEKNERQLAVYTQMCTCLSTEMRAVIANKYLPVCDAVRFVIQWHGSEKV